MTHLIVLIGAGQPHDTLQSYFSLYSFIFHLTPLLNSSSANAKIGGENVDVCSDYNYDSKSIGSHAEKRGL